MTDRPIIFSAPMVRALLDGRKTQTRRVLKPQPRLGLYGDGSIIRNDYFVWEPKPGRVIPFTDTCAYQWREHLPYAPGDRLWVREAWFPAPYPHIHYRADGELDRKWKSPIHMPRWASRLTLIVTDVRVQRVQEISGEDARAEGIYSHDHPELGRLYSYDVAGHIGVGCRNSVTVKPAGWSDPKGAFGSLWEKIHGRASWDANPWVVALTFAVHHQNIDQMQRVAAE